MNRPIQASIRTRADEAATEGQVSAAEFREAAAHWATGVAVLAARDGDEVEAVTVTAFAPVSADPPLVLACLGNDAAALYVLKAAGRFVVSVLSVEDRRAASALAQRLPLEPTPFAEGDPVLHRAMAAFVCRVWQIHPGGDHQVVIGQVERIALGEEADPLLYYRREYRALPDTR